MEGVAITTEDIDRAKTTIYASAGITDYWLVLPKSKSVVIYKESGAAEQSFSQQVTLDRNVSLSWAGQSLDLSTLFPDA